MAVHHGIFRDRGWHLGLAQSGNLGVEVFKFHRSGLAGGLFCHRGTPPCLIIANGLPSDTRQCGSGSLNCKGGQGPEGLS